MSVLRYRAGEQNREGDCAGSIERQEDQMRAGLWDDAYECGQNDHQSCIAAGPMFDVYILESYTQY